MSFVVVDLGASGTRYATELGQISVIPNNMVFLEGTDVSKINPDTPDIESCLEVQITKDGGNACEHFPANVLVGIMAEKHINTNVRPSALMSKPKQRVNFVSAIIACAISKLKYNTEDNVDLYLAVPPLQIDEAKEVFGNVLPGTYTVKLPKYNGGTEVKITVNDVEIFEESFMAIASFFFNLNGTVRDIAKPYMVGNVLSLDIGASTSDLAIVKNGRYIDKSGQTYQIGGNVARSALIDEVRKKYTFELPVAEAEKTIAEGRLQVGMRLIDVSEEVSKAKRQLAIRLADCMQNYFSNIEIPIQMIDAIVVSGGGSMQSQYINDSEVVKTSEPMSYYVTEELKKFCPDISVVSYGDDARLANTKGLYIRAMAKAAKKAAEKASQPAVAPAQPATNAPQTENITVVGGATAPSTEPITVV